MEGSEAFDICLLAAEEYLLVEEGEMVDWVVSDRVTNLLGGDLVLTGSEFLNDISFLSRNLYSV